VSGFKNKFGGLKKVFTFATPNDKRPTENQELFEQLTTA